MDTIIINGLQEGLIYAFMAMGILLTFRILGFPDLSVEGTFPLGAVVAAKAVVMGIDPLFAVLLGGLAGALGGAVTGLMHTRLKVNNILAGILTTSAIYTVMLRLMGRPNTPLLNYDNFYNRVLSFFGTSTDELSLMQNHIATITILLVMAVIIRALLGWFMKTDLGLSIRATGNNEKMIRSLGVNTDNTKLLTLIIANGMVGLSGALKCQQQGFSDVGMGIGVLIAALASVVLGEIFVRSDKISKLLTGAILGSIIYRTLLAIGMRLNFPAEDFRLISAVLVLIALVLPNLQNRRGKNSLMRAVSPKSGGEAP